MTFVVSMRPRRSTDTEKVHGWLEHYPGLRFKLDPTDDWTEELVAELAKLGCVDSVDLKGQYKGTVVDQPPNPTLYRLVAEGFPEAWIEDPAITEETRPILEPHAKRITWDAIIHSVADIKGLPWPPRSINIKPSRFGSWRDCATRTTTARRTVSRPTAGVSSSLAWGAAISSTSRRSSIPMRRTTWRRAATTFRRRDPDFPTSPLEPAL